MKKRIALAATPLLALSFITGCGDDEKTPPPPPPVVCNLDTAATPIMMGVGLAFTAAGASFGSPQDQPPLLEKIINDGCGLTGDQTTGTPIAFTVLDTQDSATTAPAVVDQLVAAGAVTLGGFGTDNPTVAAADRNLNGGNYDLPFLNASASSNGLTNCTAAQLADPAITKSTAPAANATTCFDSGRLVMRTRETSNAFGVATARFVLDKYSATPTVAMYTRNTGASFVYIAVTQKYFVDNGIASVHVTDPSGTPTAQQFKDTLIPQILANNPTVVIHGGPPQQLVNFLEGWALYEADGAIVKPSNFATLKLVNSGNAAGTNFSTMSLAARTLLDTRLQNIQPYWDDTRVGYQHWYTAWTDFYPEKTTPTSPFQMMLFDGEMIMALAIAKANSTAPADIVAQYLEVANPPGTVYYADQYAEARAAIMRGEDVDYEGAIVSDLTENLALAGAVPYGIYDFDINGIATANQVVNY